MSWLQARCISPTSSKPIKLIDPDTFASPFNPMQASTSKRTLATPPRAAFRLVSQSAATPAGFCPCLVKCEAKRKEDERGAGKG